jgi:hypothetical protein
MERKAMAIAEIIITHFMLQTSGRQGKEANLMCGVRRACPSNPQRSARRSAAQAIEFPDFLLAHFYGKFGLN